jgi:MFS family permease
MSAAIVGRTRLRWYYGWNIVATGALLTLLTVGMRLSIGPFFLPMATDLGLTRSAMSAIVAVGMVCYGLAMPLAAQLVMLRGTRFVLLLGTAIVIVATAWSVVTRDARQLLLAYGVLLSVGLAFTGPVALTPVISLWFTRRRGMALFFLSTGSMAGMALLTPVLSWAIEVAGWRTALAGFTAVFMAVSAPTALFVVREDPPPQRDALAGESVGLQPMAGAPMGNLSVIAAIATAPFLTICFGLFACGFSMNLLGTHGMPMLMDHGFNSRASALGIGLIGAVAILGTLMLGRLADRLPRRKLLALIYSVRGLGFVGLVAAGTHLQLYSVSALGGLVWAGSIALSSAVLADVYGVKMVGVLYGLAYVVHQLGGMASSWLGGWGFDTWGTHWPAFGSAAFLLFAAGFVSLRLPDRQHGN